MGELILKGMYSGLPRKEIEWYPKINYDLCTSCEVCLNFCHNEVFTKDGDKVVVSQPYNCLVGCKACAPLCTAGAITFPSRDKLKAMLRALRKKYGLR
jgi:NAD-dependent dihydropyrimidine dehydrogenase PreA subunit